MFDYPSINALVQALVASDAAPDTIGVPTPQRLTRSERIVAPRRNKAAASDAKLKAVGLEISSIAAEVLGVASLDGDESLWAHGLSSASAVQFSGQLAEAMGCSLPATLVFDYPSINALVQALVASDAASDDDEGSASLYSEVDCGAESVGDERARTYPSVVGMDYTLPGNALPLEFTVESPNADRIWTVPNPRWDSARLQSNFSNTVCNSFGGFAMDVELFDCAAFELSSRQSVSMDPQHRMLLQNTQGAISSSSEELATASLFGAYVGIAQMDNAFLALSIASDQIVDALFAISNGHSVAAGRLSYWFGFQGPCLSIDTACSSSLVACHLAAIDIESFTSDAGVGAGVNVALVSNTTTMFTQAGMLAQDGRCKTLDSRADGYVRGEACVAVHLRVAPDSPACLLGSSVNQDGRSSSLTAPNGPSQQRVINASLARGGLTPAVVSSLELHGTGTSLGDPIEISAAAAVFKTAHEVPPLSLNAAKATCGHSEPAAGALGVARSVQSLTASHVAGITHLQSINPFISSATPTSALPSCVMRMSRLPCYSATGDRDSGALSATGVSGFAFQGTNAHAEIAAEPSDGALQVAWHRLWEQSRCWITPPSHPFLHETLCSKRDHMAVFCIQLQQPLIADLCSRGHCSRVPPGSKR